MRDCPALGFGLTPRDLATISDQEVFGQTSTGPHKEVPRPHRRVENFEREDFERRLPHGLGIERFADQKLDERPVRVIAAGLFALLAAAWVDLSGFHLTQNLERLFCCCFPLGFLFLLINGLFSPLGFIGRNFFGLVVFEFVLDGIDKFERRSARED